MSGVVVPIGSAPNGPVEATRRKLLDATRLGLSRYGARKLSMTDVADLAGVSRPTLYRYFPSKEALLGALGEDEARSFDDGLASALRERPSGSRLEPALQFIVDRLHDDHLQRLVHTEPAFVLRRFADILPLYRARLAALIANEAGGERPRSSSPASYEQAADAVIRLALSYFLFPEPDRALTVDVADSLVRSTLARGRSESGLRAGGGRVGPPPTAQRNAEGSES